MFNCLYIGSRILGCLDLVSCSRLWRGQPRIQSPSLPPSLPKVSVWVFACVSGSRALGSSDFPAGAFPSLPRPGSQGAKPPEEVPKAAPRAGKCLRSASQVHPKSVQRVPCAPQEIARASQECPRAGQEQPKSGQEIPQRPKSYQEHAQSVKKRPRVSQEQPNIEIPLRVCMRLRCHVRILVYFLDLFRNSPDKSAKKRPRTKQTKRKLSQQRTLTQGCFKVKAANKAKQSTNLQNKVHSCWLSLWILLFISVLILIVLIHAIVPHCYLILLVLFLVIFSIIISVVWLHNYHDYCHRFFSLSLSISILVDYYVLVQHGRVLAKWICPSTESESPKESEVYQIARNP